MTLSALSPSSSSPCSSSSPSFVTFHCWDDADCASASSFHDEPSHWSFDAAHNDDDDTDADLLHLHPTSACPSTPSLSPSTPTTPSTPSPATSPSKHLTLPTALLLTRPSTPASRTSFAPSSSSSASSSQLSQAGDKGRFSTSQVEEAAYLFWERKTLREMAEPRPKHATW